MSECDHRPKITQIDGVANPNAITRAQWDAFWERRESTKAARDFTNYTDGGHWMGSGKDPNRLGKQELCASSVHRLKLSWPENGCVEKFRKQTAEMNERMGYVAAVAAAIATRGRGLKESLGAGVGTNWLLSNMGGIQVHRGWSYLLEVEWTFKIASYPSWRNADIDLAMRRTEILRNEEGKAEDMKTFLHSDDRVKEWPKEIIWKFVSSVSGTTDGETRIVCPNAGAFFRSD